MTSSENQLRVCTLYRTTMEREREIMILCVCVCVCVCVCLQGKDTKKVKLAETDDLIDVDEEDLEKVWSHAVM